MLFQYRYVDLLSTYDNVAYSQRGCSYSFYCLLFVEIHSNFISFNAINVIQIMLSIFHELLSDTAFQLPLHQTLDEHT